MDNRAVCSFVLVCQLSMKNLCFCDYIPVPTAPPVNIIVMPETPRVLYAGWQPPPFVEQNGVLRNYTVTVRNEDLLIIVQKQTDQLEIYVDELRPFHLYYISVAASTRIGIGPYTREILIEMPEDGICMHNTLVTHNYY